MNTLDLMILHKLKSKHLEEWKVITTMLVLSSDAMVYINREISILTEELSLLDTELARTKSQQLNELGTKLHLQNVLYLVQSGEYPLREAH